MTNMDVGALLYPKGLGRLEKAYVATVLYGEIRHSTDFIDFEDACYYLSGADAAELFEVSEFVEGQPSSMKLADIVLGEWFPTTKELDMAKVKKAINNKKVEDDFLGEDKPKKGAKAGKAGKNAKAGKEKNGKSAKGDKEAGKRGPRASIDGTKEIKVLKAYEGDSDTVFGKKWKLIKSGITVESWRKRCKDKELPGSGFPFLKSLVASGHIRLI